MQSEGYRTASPRVGKNLDEGEDFEEKSAYDGGNQDKGTLVKTIVSMANTRGGRIVLQGVSCRMAELDSAALDDLVNKYVARRVSDIRSIADADGSCVVTVPESRTKPHLFTAPFWYQDSGGKQKTPFHPGQVWVRHSSKNEPASIDDMERMTQERLARVFEQLSVRVTEPGGLIHIGADGVPVRVTDDPSASAVFGDVNKLYPHNATDVGRHIGKGAQWVSRAARHLGLRGDGRYWCPVRIGKSEYHKYSDAAVEALRRKIEASPEWSPFRAD